MTTDSKLVKTGKEAIALVGIAAGIGFISKKFLRKAVTNDPSTSLMNAREWVLVMMGSIYARDYLVDQKVISS